MNNRYSLLNNFLLSGHSFNDEEILLKFKYKILNIILVVMSLFSFIFASLSSLKINPIGDIQTVANYIFAFFIIFIIIMLRRFKDKYYKLAYLLYVVSFLNFVSAFIFVPDDEFRMIWFYLLGFAAYITGNTRAGNTVIFFSICVIVFSSIYLDINLTQKAIVSSVLGLIITMLFFRAYTEKIISFDKEIIQKNNFIINQLEYKVEEEVKKRIKQEKITVTKSRQAQMGEMISMIAHQWRQPLGAISSHSIDLQMKLSLETFDLNSKEGIQKASEYFLDNLSQIDSLVHTLTSTIDDFRNFYKENKQTSKVKLKSILLKSLNIIKTSLLNDNIDIVEQYNSNEHYDVYDNELTQVILNIFKNSQDNFKDKNILNPKITIQIKDNIIKICDNGGGIEENIMQDIFDPYFTTKNEKNGTGLGLYMSKTIIESHHHGELTAVNEGAGVCFIIKIGKTTN